MAPESNRLLSGPSSFSPAQNPVFYEGNTARIELHILAGAGVGKVPYEVAFPAGASIKLAVGQVNAFPTSGTWQLMVDDVETADMPFNATPAQVQAALNALATVQAAGGVTSALNGDGYTVTWNTYGTKPDIGIGSDTLVPSSYESISLVQQGTADNRKVIYIELRQAPVALGVEWDPLPTPVMTVEEVAAWNGTTKTWRFNIEPAPKAGSYNLTVAGASTKSYTLSYAATADNITTAISKDFAGAKAYKTGETQFDIVFNEDVTLTSDGNGLIGYLGFIGNVNFSTAEIHQFIGGLASRQTTLEVAIEAGGIPQTLIQVPCVVSSDVISNGVLQPLPLGTAMSEQVANARFVRRDVDQSPDVPTKNQIWENLGLTEHDGHDVVSALSSSVSPSGANPFVTWSDISGLGATWGNITGTLSDQTDLQSALDSKYDASNPSGFIPEANVDSNTYGRKDGTWVTVLPLTGGTIDGSVTINNSTYGTNCVNDGQNIQFNQGGGFTQLNTQALILSASGSTLSINNSAITFPDSTQQSTAFPGFSGYATESWVNSQGFITAGSIGDMATMTWVYEQNYTTLEAAQSWTQSQGYLTFDSYNRLSFAGGYNPDPSPIAGRLWFQSDKFRYSTSTAQLNALASEGFVTGMLSSYAPINSPTFTGKVNTPAPTSTNAGLNIGSINSTANLTNSVAGDVWIGTWQMAYKTANGTLVYGAATNASNVFGSPQIIDTTAATAALRVTQKGTGNAIEVEDELSPDATRFVVNQFGKVGVGTAPDATAAIKLDANGISFNGLVFNPTATAAHTGGTDTLDLLVTINGVNYRLGLRPA